MNKNHVLWITQAGVLIALLVAWQAVSRLVPGTLLTGSGVNFILVIAVLFCSLRVGLCVAIISPVMAWVFGVAPPFPVIIPFIAAANTAYILIWHFLLLHKKAWLNKIAALILGATAKFIILYIGVVKILVELLEIIPAPLTIPFSFPQLFTAAIGGAVAILALPVLQKALPHKE